MGAPAPSGPSQPIGPAPGLMDTPVDAAADQAGPSLATPPGLTPLAAESAAMEEVVAEADDEGV
eukprot:577148-Alexandrium_andersonii.AAC.1